jgi:hypothetical protein
LWGKASIKQSGKMSWLKKNTSAYEMSNNFDDLFKELIQRNHWKKIKPDIIKSIFNNASGDINAIKRFIYISERYNTVGNNFVELTKTVSEKYLLSNFGLALYWLGSQLIKALSSVKTEDEARLLSMHAAMAFSSSLLCDQFLLSSYCALAFLYSSVDKDIALEWCAKYKKLEDRLLNTSDNELSDSELIAKRPIVNLKEDLKIISEYSPHLLHDRWEEEVNKSMRDRINELEEELLQS